MRHYPNYIVGPSSRSCHCVLPSRRFALRNLAICIAALIAQPTTAATISVPAGANLFTYAPTSPPAAGDTWNLGGAGIFLANTASSSSGKTLPTGTASTVSLTINGNGNAITLNDGGGHYANFWNTTALNLSLSNLTITGSNNTNSAGTIYTGSGSLWLTTAGAVTFSNNTSKSGGALFATNGSVIVTGGATFDSNHATSATGYGGGIYADLNVSFANSGLSSVVVTNNTAVAGGAGLNAGNNVTTTGTTLISSNTAGSNGGGVRAVSGNVGLATTSGDVTLTNNAAGTSGTGNGGGVFANGTGQVTLGNSAGLVTITGNRAGFNSAGSAVNATSNGGGIYAAGTTTLIGSALTLSNNMATARGGGIYTAGTATLTGTMITMSNNTANLAGGGIYTPQTVTVAGALTANGNSAFAPSATGGAIAANAGVTVTGDVAMDGNTAGFSGGAIFSNGAVRLASTSGNVSLTNNSATSATNGGGGAVAASGSVSLGNASSTVTLTGNSANYSAGAVYSATSISVPGTLTASNNTTGLDGGVFASDEITVSNTTSMQTNSAAGDGGAIWAYGGNVSLAASTGNVTLTHNTANGRGGAIFDYLGNVAIGNTSGTVILSNNLAGTNGGGIYASQALSVTGALTANSNSALGGDGGAIYAAGGIDINASGSSSIGSNTATGQGGALWSGGNLSLTATNGDMAVTGNSAGGLGGAFYIDPNALTISATGGDITFSGNAQNTAGTPQANAIYIANVSGGSTVTLDAEAGHIITFYDPIQNDGTKGVVTVTKTGDGLVSFDGSNYTNETDRWSQMYANTEVQAGTFEIANNAAYGSRAADVGGTVPSTFIVDTGTILQGGGESSLLADQVTLQNNATLNLAGRQPGVRAVFGINAANVNFTPGSVILFNTYLNDATVQNSDRLVLSRTTTSGTGTVLVNNIDGPGGLTVGDGIQLVATINGATTNADSFVLGGRVAAGAYEYTLERGGSVNGDDWFLRDTYVAPPAPPGPPAPPVPPAPPSPPAPPGPPDPPVPPAPPYPPAPAPTPSGEPLPPALPDYRVEVPVDSAVPALANQIGLAMLSNYHDRGGEDYAQVGDDSNGPPDNNGARPSSGWGRIFGTNGSVGYGSGDVNDHFNNFMSNGPSYDFTLYGFQTGLDLYRTDDDGDRNIAGVSLGADRVSSDVRNIYDGTQAGRVSMDGYTLGSYWTRKGPSGWYVDGVIQISRYDSIHASSIEGQELDSSGSGIDLSLEGGYPFNLGNEWKLEPQGQVIYQHISLSGGHDSFGQITYYGGDELYGRLGLRLLHDWKLSNGYPITAWARVNVWGVMGPEAKTTFAGLDGLDAIAFGTSLGSAWWQAQLGLSGQVAARVSLFGSLDYDRPLSSANGHGIGGRIGVRWVW